MFSFEGIFNWILLIGSILGFVAVIAETHEHGFRQYALVIGMGLTVAAMLGLVFSGDRAPHWLLTVARILAACGIGAVGWHLVHHYHHHHHYVRMVIGGTIVVLLIGVIFAYDPVTNRLKSPVNGIAASMPSLPQAPQAFSVGRTPGFGRPAAPAATVVVAPPPTRPVVNQVSGFAKVDCSRLSFERRKRCEANQ